MNLINYFHPQSSTNDLPTQLRNPFDNNPHQIAITAAEHLKRLLQKDQSLNRMLLKEGQGKMFGVLVIQDQKGQVGYLSAFSGMLFNKWAVSGYVPPVFNVEEMELLLRHGEQEIDALTLRINSLEQNQERKQLLAALQSYEQTSVLQLSELKKTHKSNKSKRKILRELALTKNNATESNLFNLSQQSQDDKREYKALKLDVSKNKNNKLNLINNLFDDELQQLKIKRKKKSSALHKNVFKRYQLKNAAGVTRELTQLFADKLPPGGTADCAAPKLIHYAIAHNLKMLALSEFWWGASPKKEIRHHQQFYPPCRSKCHHIIPFMLDGLELEMRGKIYHKYLEPKIIYEDDDLLVLNKPDGLLSIPGKEQKHSVLSWLKDKYPTAEGGLLLHRLDQATSGIMLAAKNSKTYKDIQQQFIKRQIKKRYVAVLEYPLPKNKIDIDLPLMVDIDDRPRQLVCFEHGKQAQTQVELIKLEEGQCRVYFYPKTGRTHQLRVHAAHELGLANPIVGDTLYGKKAERLMLHAEQIEFFHPVKREMCLFKVSVPF